MALGAREDAREKADLIRVIVSARSLSKQKLDKLLRDLDREAE